MTGDVSVRAWPLCDPLPDVWPERPRRGRSCATRRAGRPAGRVFSRHRRRLHRPIPETSSCGRALANRAPSSSPRPTARACRALWRLAGLFLFRNLLAFFPRLGEADGDGLLAAFHLAALTAFAALGGAALIAVHFVFDVAAGATRIFSLPLLGHVISSKPVLAIFDPPDVAVR